MNNEHIALEILCPHNPEAKAAISKRLSVRRHSEGVMQFLVGKISIQSGVTALAYQ
jgi:hypothetical protein